MIKNITESAKSDSKLAGLLDEAKEYAQVYVLTRQRQKGCDGMDELAIIKEESRDIVDEVIQYSQEKKYISQDVSYDIDSIAEEIIKGQDTL